MREVQPDRKVGASKASKLWIPVGETRDDTREPKRL